MNIDNNLIVYYTIGIFLTLITSVTVYSISRHYRIRPSFYLILLFILCSMYTLVTQLLKYSTLNFYVDFSHWLHILHNISTTGKPESLNVELMVPGTLNYFSVHFAPLLYLFAIPFKLWPHGETIIVLNFLLMVSSVIPLYKLAYVYYKDKSFSRFMMVLLLWYPTFQYTVLYEFEMLRFSIPIIFWMLYFWEKRNLCGYFIFVLLALLVREEVGLTIMMFGLYLFFVEKNRRVGIITTLIGLAAFVAIMQILMPALRTGSEQRHISVGFFSDFGNTPREVIVNVTVHPIHTLMKILQPIKLANIFMFFLPLLFVPLLAPMVLVIALANFGIALLSKANTHLSYMLYYLSPSVPFIFYAFIKGWPKLLIFLRRISGKRHDNSSSFVGSAAMMGVLCGLLVTNVFFGPSPVSLQFWFKNLRPAPFRTQNFHYSVYKVTDHHRKVEQFVELIPDTAIVSAEHFFHPRLAQKKGAMVFPQLESLDGQIKADYAFFDKKNPIKTGLGLVPGSWDGIRNNPQYYYDWVEKENWKLIKSEDGYFLYQRVKSKPNETGTSE